MGEDLPPTFACSPIHVVRESTRDFVPHPDGLYSVTMRAKRRNGQVHDRELFVSSKDYAERMVAAMNAAHAEAVDFLMRGGV